MNQSHNTNSSSDSNQTTHEDEIKFNQAYKQVIIYLFRSSNLSPKVQYQIIADLSDERLGVKEIKAVIDPIELKDTDVNKCCEKVFRKAKEKGYDVVTRFVPPYCSTVTFYSDSIGFVTVSRLGADFDPTSTRISESNSKSSRDSTSAADSTQNPTHKDQDKGYYVTTGAIKTLTAAYFDATQISQAREVSWSGTVRDPRDKAAHERALEEYKKNVEDYNKHNPRAPEPIGRNMIYIRLEEDGLPVGVQTIQKCEEEEEPLSTKSNLVAFIYQACVRFCYTLMYQLRILLHKLLVTSKVDFRHGPAAVRNDFLFNTHNGKYAQRVRVVDGELSACLNRIGRAVASSNLTAFNGIVSASIALFSSATARSELNYTGLIVAGSLLITLLFWQMIWTRLITSTAYENIAFNDFRVRKVHEAAALFGMNPYYLELFLAVISPQRSIRAHGFHNSYIDISKTGVLEVSNSKAMSSEILYHAGYITTELKESSTIATWVPYDTHRIVYPSNDKVRKLSIVDGFIHLYSSRISAIEDLSYQQGYQGGDRSLDDLMDLLPLDEQLPADVKTWRHLQTWLRDRDKTKEKFSNKPNFFFQCDGNYLDMPKRLYLYGNGRNFAVG
ncbi:hypothetical protein X797_002916 [Metarhizium robertsii]|uniref:Beta-lactamase domain protein n=2 Tax=Metarhizium robertsii TaxID=568076 RepID=A0A0B2XER5_METRA|nr:beta-lactamase domain protein [Metarhizium robertsii ARSEF 23]EXV05228.1 hypothetical protein X797_002916 [Metarhizium robertsii]KHO11215.1 beta-lactamase domain protein [Metarhizium robertsii ARSEF 23]